MALQNPQKTFDLIFSGSFQPDFHQRAEEQSAFPVGIPPCQKMRVSPLSRKGDFPWKILIGAFSIPKILPKKGQSPYPF